MSAIRQPVHPISHGRRRLLQSLFLGGGAVALGPFLKACGDSAAPAGSLKGSGQLGIPPGPLSRIGALGARDADGAAVPEGFTVRAVARTGNPPALGGSYPWHTFTDGGACYARPEGGWIYTSNSEVPGGAGGCGALVFDADGAVVDAYSILTNTSSNCAGGKTPWDTWLSCEEDASGQAWETDPFGAVGAVPKPALGLFAHEAAAVDLRNRVVYLTEDEGNSRLYRWVADTADFSSSGQRLALESGTLQVMNIMGFEDGGYPAIEQIRELLPVSWIDAVSPDQPQGTVRADLAAAGKPVPGTQIKGGEGLWFYELPAEAATVPPGGLKPTRGLVFFSSKGDNRIYALDVENQLIEVIFDNEQIEPDFDDVDNVTVSPWGDIIVVEDLVAVGRGIRLIVVVPNQPAKVLVDLRQPGSEITGPAFSPDGSRLYFSSQRGPNVPGGQVGVPDDAPGCGTGATYELTIPPEFRGG